jgi:hypothetical protein
LERQSVSGQFFASDSRFSIEFDPIRVKAFEAIAQVKPISGHPNVEFVWDIRPGWPQEIQDFKIRKAKETAEFFNSVFKSKIKIYALLATEKDVEYPPVKNFYFSDTRESLQRLSLMDNRRWRILEPRGRDCGSFLFRNTIHSEDKQLRT